MLDFLLSHKQSDCSPLYILLSLNISNVPETSVSSSLRCRFVYFSAFCRFSTPLTGKPRHGWGLSYKVFSRSFFSTQTVCWVKNKLCVCSKLGNAATSQKSKCLLFISANTRIGEYLDFDTIRFQQYQITFRRPHVTSMQLKLAPDEKSKKILKFFPPFSSPWEMRLISPVQMRHISQNCYKIHGKESGADNRPQDHTKTVWVCLDFSSILLCRKYVLICMTPCCAGGLPIWWGVGEEVLLDFYPGELNSKVKGEEGELTTPMSWCSTKCLRCCTARRTCKRWGEFRLPTSTNIPESSSRFRSFASTWCIG